MNATTIALVRSVTPILLGLLATVVVLAALGVDPSWVATVAAGLVGAAVKAAALWREANGSTIAGRIQGIPTRPNYEEQ